MNLFNLAEQELQREGVDIDNKNYMSLLINRAISIRKYLDLKQNNIEKNQFKKRT